MLYLTKPLIFYILEKKMLPSWTSISTNVEFERLEFFMNQRNVFIKVHRKLRFAIIKIRKQILFSGNVPFSTEMFKQLIDKFQVRKDYAATTFLFYIISILQETSSWSYTIDTVNFYDELTSNEFWFKAVCSLM